MEKYTLTYKAFGENAILIEWPKKIEEEILYDIIKLQRELEIQLADIVYECIPAYQSLTLFYNNNIIKYNKLILKISGIYKSAETAQNYQLKLWHIPVCYDATFGLDQEYIAQQTGLPVNKIIELHSNTIYTAYFIGFLPGFIYLGGLPKPLYTPRKSSPRPNVIKGSVAIAGDQTGIYPQENPGGWNIIGNSPISFFDINKTPPVFTCIGDKIKFYPIDLKEHEEFTILVMSGGYSPKMEHYQV